MIGNGREIRGGKRSGEKSRINEKEEEGGKERKGQEMKGRERKQRRDEDQKEKLEKVRERGRKE